MPDALQPPPGNDNALPEAALTAGDTLFRQPWTFLKSAPAAEFLPEADRAEIAFAGRSNVGKSSVINALVNQHGLARTSNTPGRTQELNYFLTERAPLYLVDMPGYGFAEAPKAKVDAWTVLVRDYLAGRTTLARLFLLIDSRHGIKPLDEEVMGMLDTAAVVFEVVLTKIDKIKPEAVAGVKAATAAILARHPAAFPRLIATSSEKGFGLAELRAEIATSSGRR